jgi:hypothetical protein
MKEKFRILRVGGLNFSSSKFLDLLDHDLVEKLVIVDFEHKSYYIKDLYKTAEFFHKTNLLKKLEVHWIKLGFVKKVFFRTGSTILGRYIPNKIYSKIFINNFKAILNSNNYDFIWVGDNDFDLSNLIFYVLHKYIGGKKPFVRSYKETRFAKKWDEEYMLMHSDSLIFPNEKYVSFFEKLYSFKPKNIYIADLDWRYSRLIRFVKNLSVQKLSKIDGKPHVCLMTGRALCDTSEERSGFRYYFVPIINELVKRGIYVHLHTLKIVPSKKYGNVYEDIAKQTGLLKIEKPLDLSVYSNGYNILKRYDAGILHSPIPESVIPLYEFQQLNIPNRLYEYQIADVVPLLQKETLPAVEQIINETNFGITYNDYDDLAYKLNQLVKGDVKKSLELEKINDCSKFASVLLKSASNLLNRKGL